MIAWAGYDHVQLARAIAVCYELANEREAGSSSRYWPPLGN